MIRIINVNTNLAEPSLWFGSEEIITHITNINNNY